MIRFPVAIVFLAAFISTFAEDDFKVIETDLGHVQGRVLHTLLDNRPFFAFRGIPYAKVPVGVLRFKPPQSPEPWTKVKDALSFGNACTQPTFDMKSIVGDEDCLFINVFTPELSPVTPLPVVVAVHGGGYYAGSGEWLGPDFLLNEDVVLVTFNYRLGPLGFLSMGTADYPGNQGLKDQLLALRWVNRNIHKFGGDNAKITLYGQSAGASAVHLHMVSPQSHGLFQRAILSSGSALDTWSYNTRPKHMEVLEKLATVAGVSIKTDSDVAQFLATVDAKLLVEKTHKPFYIPFTNTKESDILWAPVIEAPDAIEPFLQESPEKLLREQSSESHIDTLFGFNNAESLFVTALELSKPESLVPFNKDFNVQLPLRHIKYEYNSDIYREYASEIRKFYFGDKNVTKSLVEFSDLMSDVLFNYGIHVAARDHARLSAANTFYYIFSVERGLNILRQYILNTSALSLPGSTHADELGYLFRVEAADVVPQEIYATLTSDSEEAKVVRQMTKLFANFAAFGTPTPKDEPVAWKPIKDGVINYVNITNDGLVAGVNPNDKRFAFWDNFFKRNSRSLWETDHEITVDELLIITGHI